MLRTGGWLVLAALAIASGGCNSSTSGCTAANCQAMQDSCDLGVSGEPLSPCVAIVSAAGGTVPSDLTQEGVTECQKACDAHGQGQLVACVAKNASLCNPTVDDSQSVVTECSNGLTTLDETCSDTCFSAFQTCVQGCPSSSFSACVACGDTCDTTYAACDQKCPTAS